MEHIARMEVEASELHTKIKALNSFIQYNPIFLTLDDKRRHLMEVQADSMSAYFIALTARIELERELAQ